MAKKHKTSRKVRKSRNVRHKKSRKGILPLEVLKNRARKLISLVRSRGGSV